MCEAPRSLGRFIFYSLTCNASMYRRNSLSVIRTDLPIFKATNRPASISLYSVDRESAVRSLTSVRDRRFGVLMSLVMMLLV